MNMENLIKNLEDKYYNNLVNYAKKIKLDEDLIINGKNISKTEELIVDTEIQFLF